jgi:hypothetical protein
MNSLAMAQDGSSGVVSLVRVTCYLLLLVSGSPLYAFHDGVGARPLSSMEHAHRAVWQMQNFGPQESIESTPGGSTGMAFATGPRYFLTNSCVWRNLLEGRRNAGTLFPIHRDHLPHLTVHKLLAVWNVYALAPLEVKKSVELYLSLADGFPLGPGVQFSC